MEAATGLAGEAQGKQEGEESPKHDEFNSFIF